MNFKDKKIYTIATAHLDTVWNWDFEYVIEECLKNTLDDNFALFEKYPDYRFNFEGSYRYELFEEYYPEKFEKLKEYVAEGRWNVTGSAFENGDVNVPSPESLFRNILYGNKYFERTFGKKSNDIFLPDCFGFGWALPSIINHAGLKGFSTQKLTWGGAYGRPFDIGLWYGVDGKPAYASVDARSYCTSFKEVRTKKDVADKLNNNITKYSFPWTFTYHGVGDIGGAPKEESVKTVCRELAENDAQDIKVLSASPTEFFEDMAKLDDTDIARLPTWNNELVMTDHGVGSYISRAFSKRCNRKNEELADMAERAAVTAGALCNADYPKSELDAGWKRTIAHTFHDDITGTSVQRVYQRSWNDYILSANQLNNVYEASSAEIIKNLDTSWVKGFAVVLGNSVEHGRFAAADLEIPKAPGYEYVRAFDKAGREIPAQVNSSNGKTMKVSVAACVPATGYTVVDVMYSKEPCKVNTGIRVGSRTMENFKYIVSIDDNGDISSIIDKTMGDSELLNKPIRFELNKYDGADEYAAWELRYKEINKYPWEFARRGVCTVVEKGPVRATLKVVQKAGKSTFTYYVSLVAGCPWVSVYNEIEWREFRRALHNGFCFNASNSHATFDLGLGAIKRGNANKKLYSVPAQKWADLTDDSGAFGISVFSDCKYGWMKKDNRTLRLTVLHSPKKNYRHDSVQRMLEFGLNRYGYAIYSHAGDYSNGTQLNARFFNQPVTAFISDKHEGVLGDNYSFCSISNEDVIVRAIKKAEDSDEIIIRVNEGACKIAQNVEITLGKGIVSAVECNAYEDKLADTKVVDGKLVFDLEPYEIKTFAVKLADATVSDATQQAVVELPYNRNIVTYNHNRATTVIPVVNASIPGEIFPKTIECAGVKFKTAEIAEGMNNAVIADGQTLSVYGKKLYFVAASIGGDKTFNFKVGDKTVAVPVQSINDRIGRWDLYDLGEVANIKTDKLAWECTHTHALNGDNAGAQLFFFMYELNLGDAETVTLPKDKDLLILAATQSRDGSFIKLQTELYDRIEGRQFDYKMTVKEKIAHEYNKLRSKKPHNKS